MKRLLLALMGLLAPTTLWAVEVHDELTFHVVQEGESLHDITQDYLGVSFLWPENWKLNPDIEDPHLLRTGQVITVIKSRTITADRASVDSVSNRAEKKLRLAQWSPASPGDQLSAEEGIRTFENSSAELAFNQRSRVRLDEFSQIFLRAKETDLRGQDRGEVEVIRGAAEIEFAPLKRDHTQIEIVSGPARATTEADQSGKAKVRMRQDQGSALVMVYQGRSTVSAGTAQVMVESGQGLAVNSDGSTHMPEALLPAPQLHHPAAGEALGYVNQAFSWATVSNATSYVIEICADPQCTNLLISQTTETAEHRFDVIPVGEHYWRVAGRSDSGLRGYAAAPRPLSLDHAKVDDQPPSIAIVPIGFVKEDPLGPIWLAPDTRLKIVAADALSGLASVRYRFDDQAAWTEYAGDALQLPTGTGSTRLSVIAKDQIGLSSQWSMQWQVVPGE